MEYIIGFIIFSLISFGASMKVLVSIVAEIAQEVAKAGFIIDIDKAKEMVTPEEIKKNRVLMYTPLINVIYAYYVRGQYYSKKGMVSDNFSALGMAYEMSDYQKEEFKKNPSKMNALLLAATSEKDKKEVLTAAIASKEGSGKIFYKSSFNEENKKYNFEILGCTDSIKNLTSEKQEELLLERFVKMAEFNQNVTGTDHESEFREQLINEYKELRENIVVLNTYMEKEKEEEEIKTYKKDITK